MGRRDFGDVDRIIKEVHLKLSGLGVDLVTYRMTTPFKSVQAFVTISKGMNSRHSFAGVVGLGCPLNSRNSENEAGPPESYVAPLVKLDLMHHKPENHHGDFFHG